MRAEEIISRLPYQKPFLYVDGLTEISSERIEGHYTFRHDEFFYDGHFVDNPVTPGVILTECMAQIALVCHGLYLLHQAGKGTPVAVAFTSADVSFLIPVLPGERVQVESELVYFRMGKIKSKVRLISKNGVACMGELSGMLKS
jgi:3-hydroxyacyl-[acyl-carrier-protein] dehydratase